MVVSDTLVYDMVVSDIMVSGTSTSEIVVSDIGVMAMVRQLWQHKNKQPQVAAKVRGRCAVRVGSPGRGAKPNTKCPKQQYCSQS